jgi:hypothetical protein
MEKKILEGGSIAGRKNIGSTAGDIRIDKDTGTGRKGDSISGDIEDWD